jgi:hypothetical protein
MLAGTVASVACDQFDAARRAVSASPSPAAGSSGGASVPGSSAPAYREGSDPVQTAQAPRPVATPVPTPPPLVAPEGTSIPVVLKTTAASNTSRSGDAVTATVASDVLVDGKVVIPEGSEVRGRVVAAEGSGRVKGRAHLAVSFDEIVVGGKTLPASLSGLDVTAASGKGKDAKIIGGAAAAGAIIGGIKKGAKGAAVGGLIGAGAGGGATMAMKGKEVVFGAGSRHTLKLRDSLRVR